MIYEIGSHTTVTAADLTRDLHIDPAYLIRILRRFRTQDLVHTEQDKNDRRSLNLFLTETGRAEWETLRDQSRQQVAQSLTSLGVMVNRR